MFRTLDFWIQTVLMFVFIPPILIDVICMLFTFNMITHYSGLSLLVAMFLGPYQVLSAILSVIYEQEKRRILYLIGVAIYFGVPNLLMPTVNVNPPEFVLILAAVTPVFLAIWYYKMTYKAYKKVT